ncbi:hypothetical protein FNV43_RR13107 [Rhamnella rubrinervis]|uniref:Retrotransposon gag domain-containing protein n=1 Tax=Rhamnella rubrinervis TaxID=2594499 RepID=A0A8K0H0J3_9ROSA|nr:hypothetical protein FNV43_RR13107 [Rhamnella rubrinervis]
MSHEKAQARVEDGNADQSSRLNKQNCGENGGHSRRILRSMSRAETSTRRTSTSPKGEKLLEIIISIGEGMETFIMRDAMMYKVFASSLKGPALVWFSLLPSRNIGSFLALAQ